MVLREKNSEKYTTNKINKIQSKRKKSNLFLEYRDKFDVIIVAGMFIVCYELMNEWLKELVNGLKNIRIGCIVHEQLRDITVFLFYIYFHNVFSLSRMYMYVCLFVCLDAGV